MIRKIIFVLLTLAIGAPLQAMNYKNLIGWAQKGLEHGKKESSGAPAPLQAKPHEIVVECQYTNDVEPDIFTLDRDIYLPIIKQSKTLKHMIADMNDSSHIILLKDSDLDAHYMKETLLPLMEKLWQGKDVTDELKNLPFQDYMKLYEAADYLEIKGLQNAVQKTFYDQIKDCWYKPDVYAQLKEMPTHKKEWLKKGLPVPTIDHDYLKSLLKNPEIKQLNNNTFFNPITQDLYETNIVDDLDSGKRKIKIMQCDFNTLQTIKEEITLALDFHIYDTILLDNASWSPDGSWCIFKSNNDITKQCKIYCVDLKTGDCIYSFNGSKWAMSEDCSTFAVVDDKTIILYGKSDAFIMPISTIQASNSVNALALSSNGALCAFYTEDNKLSIFDIDAQNYFDIKGTSYINSLYFAHNNQGLVGIGEDLSTFSIDRQRKKLEKKGYIRGVAAYNSFFDAKNYLFLCNENSPFEESFFIEDNAFSVFSLKDLSKPRRIISIHEPLSLKNGSSNFLGLFKKGVNLELRTFNNTQQLSDQLTKIPLEQQLFLLNLEEKSEITLDNEAFQETIKALKNNNTLSDKNYIESLPCYEPKSTLDALQKKSRDVSHWVQRTFMPNSDFEWQRSLFLGALLSIGSVCAGFLGTGAYFNYYYPPTDRRY